MILPGDNTDDDRIVYSESRFADNVSLILSGIYRDVERFVAKLESHCGKIQSIDWQIGSVESTSNSNQIAVFHAVNSS